MNKAIDIIGRILMIGSAFFILAYYMVSASYREWMITLFRDHYPMVVAVLAFLAGILILSREYWTRVLLRK